MIIYLTLLGWATLLAQMVMPTFSWLGGIRPSLIALVIIYGALTLRGLSIFIVTTVLGFSLDLLSPNRLGVSVITLSALAALILTQREFNMTRRWDYQLLLILVGTFFYLLLDYIFYILQVWHFLFPFALWTSIALASLFNAIIGPFFLALFNIIPRALGWSSALTGKKRTEFSSYAG